MKRVFLACTVFFLVMGCNSTSTETKSAAESADAKPAESAPAVELPYKALYSSQWNQDVPDQDLLNVLNSYKSWENGDMNALSATLGDSIQFYAWDGYQYTGPKAALIERWGKFRDSLSAVKIEMDGWIKNHSIDKKTDIISVWYKETDTYKTGKIDSAYYQEDNMVANGKIVWYSQHRQELKPKKN
ncbi:MAG: hypothetical protein SFU87_12630 [Chitinophagaceae bacterium]|nr:hypothetical protein [Chitinophagaceae bacterium]